MNDTSNISISQLRQNTAGIINSIITQQKPAIIYQRSKPKAVLVDLDYFQSLEEALLDSSDSHEAERAKKEKKGPFSSYLQKRWGRSDL